MDRAEPPEINKEAGMEHDREAAIATQIPVRWMETSIQRRDCYRGAELICVI
ncbi:hypothetical protein E2C01_100209 [Portunus trituberculatus]|uniref:Uncharacterized protein n=1 Tax=Portunus trituberculatus TaxID=210409 RepID=A0A5B7KIU0_PORTR|nr:hypothetical protein [Portunus trituberculatus]